MGALVVTFANHPMEVLRHGVAGQMLSPGGEKVELLRQTGVDGVALLDFTPELAQMSARDFMQRVLKEQCHVEVLLMGYDNRFGHDGLGFADYVEQGREMGLEVLPCDELEGGFSSTAIRQALLEGDVEAANRLLGYEYRLEGTVVEGFQNGRKMGFPTANLRVSPLKLVPENGVYVVRVSSSHGGMLNIGTRPTLHNGGERSIEVHVFDFDGDLYGQTLQVELLHRLRREQEFGSMEELRAQLERDREMCRKWMGRMKSDNLLEV